MSDEISYKIPYSGPVGKKIAMDRRGLLLNGKRVLPVMGEVHYSRLSRKVWRETLTAMKNGGITVIATYVLWNHHEEEEGIFKWEDRRDLRTFIDLCAELDLPVFLRVGPWCHGEARYGGFPDWLVRRFPVGLRTSFSPYLRYVKRYFKELFKQIEGFGWSDGGPIAAVQLENEYFIRSRFGVSYLRKLKEMAIEMGLKVPIYGLTGWPPSKLFPASEFLPFWGDYPAAPWTSHTRAIDRSARYRFISEHAAEGIGTDLLKNRNSKGSEKAKINPFCFAELGVGNQVTDHRRPAFTAEDGYAMALLKAGSGAALPGYYMFTGGSNPPSALTSLEENKRTGYPNDLPRISYDFHAPIGEAGDRKGPYHKMKNLHYALHDFAEQLSAGILQIGPDSVSPGWSYRGGEKGGFLFINNHNRYTKTEDLKDQIFDIHFKDDNETVGPLNIPSKLSFFLPVRLPLSAAGNEGQDALISQSTTQPLGFVSNGNVRDYFFACLPGVNPLFILENDANWKVHKGTWTIDQQENKRIFRPVESSAKISALRNETPNGLIRIVLIPSHQSDIFWKNKTTACLGTNETTIDGDLIHHYSSSSQIETSLWNSINGEFEKGLLTAEMINPEINSFPSVLSHYESDWGWPKDRKLVTKAELHGNMIAPAEFSAGRLINMPLETGRVSRNLSNSDLKKLIHAEKLDLTPEQSGVLCLEIEEERGHRYRVNLGNKSIADSAVLSGRYTIKLSGLVRDESVRDYRLKIQYLGDKAELRINGKLVADHFNQGFPWIISLDRISLGYEWPESLELDLIPRKKGKKIYLEGPMEKEDLFRTDLLKAEIMPLYKFSQKSSLKGV